MPYAIDSASISHLECQRAGSRGLFALSAAPEGNGKEGLYRGRKMFEILARTIIARSFQHEQLRTLFTRTGEIAGEPILHCLWQPGSGIGRGSEQQAITSVRDSNFSGTLHDDAAQPFMVTQSSMKLPADAVEQ